MAFDGGLTQASLHQIRYGRQSKMVSLYLDKCQEESGQQSKRHYETASRVWCPFQAQEGGID